MQPKPSQDEAARQDFVYDLREFLTDKVYARITPYYHTRVEPGFEKRHGRKPADKKEVRDVMLADQGYQSWSLLQRLSQQMMFTSVIDTVERTLPDLVKQSKKDLNLGSLRLDERVEVPKYLTAYDIHQQPGGYHSEHTEDDLAAGAIYDVSLPIYSRDAMGYENDILAQAIVNYVNKYITDLRPKKILDLGCGENKVEGGVGLDNVSLSDVDIAYDLLDFPYPIENESYDIIYLRNVIEHFYLNDIEKIFNECFRILVLGGMLYVTVPHAFSVSAFTDPTHKQFFTFERCFKHLGNIKFRLKTQNLNLLSLVVGIFCQPKCGYGIFLDWKEKKTRVPEW